MSGAWVPAVMPVDNAGRPGVVWYMHEPCGMVTNGMINRPPSGMCYVCDKETTEPDTWTLLYVHLANVDDPNLPVTKRVEYARERINNLIAEAHAAGVRCPLDVCEECVGRGLSDWHGNAAP